MIDAIAEPNVPDLIFITDRNDEGGTDWRARFGSKMIAGWNLTCGRVYTPDIPTREVGVAFNPTRITLKPDELLSGSDSCAKLVLDRAKKTNNLLVFTHGYNNSFADVLSRARAFAEDIKFRGVVLVWSWPSQGWPSAYLDDEKAVAWSSDHFTEFVTKLMSADKDHLKVDFFAHSMGNHMLMELTTSLKKDWPGLGRAIVFAAPDIAIEEFSQRALPDRFQTLYSSEGDRALQVSSQFLHREGRAGGSVLIVSGVESIDAVLRGHSYVFEDPRALRDLARLLSTQENASARGLTERRRGNDRYWVINP